MSRSDKLPEPVKVPNEKVLKTLSDARGYLLSLPKARQNEGAVEVACHMLMMASERKGVGMMLTMALKKSVAGTTSADLTYRTSR
jgi:hypothetical protein